MPHAANPLTESFYPPAVLLERLPALDALAWLAAGHLTLLALFVLLYLRVIGLTTPAALFGALGAGLSGWVAAHLQNVQLVAVVSWIPLGLWGIESCLRGRPCRGAAATAVAIAMSWLAGFPQLAFLGSLALGLYAVVGLLGARPRERQKGFLATAILLLLAAIVGLSLAAPQIVPSRGLAGEAGHYGRTLDDLREDRLRPPVLVGSLLPRMLGDPMRDAPWIEHWGARILLGEPRADGILPPPAVGWGERTLYPGILVLPLALLGLFAAPRRIALALLLIGALGGAASLSRTAIGVLHEVPGFNFGAPSRAIALPCIVSPLLAAWGLEWLLRREAPWPLGRLFRWLAGLPVAVAALAAVAAHLFPEASLLQAIEWLKAGGVEQRFGVTEPRPASDYLEAMRPAFEDLRIDLTIFAAVGGAAILLFWRGRRWDAPRPALAALASLLLLADLLAFMAPVNLPVTRERLFATTPALEFLAARKEEGRILRVARDEATALREADSLLVPNLGILHGLNDVQGWRELVPRDYLALWEGISARVTPVGFAGVPVARLTSPVIALTRARWLVASEPQPALEAWRVHPPAEAPGELYVYENPRALPEAWIVHETRLVASRDEARALVKDPAFDPAAVVVLDRDGGEVPTEAPPPGASAESARVVARHAERVEIVCEAAAPGVLVLPETWDEGWRALAGPADGGDEALVDVPVRIADSCFRAVALPAGRSRVVFIHAPDTIEHGFLIAAAGALGLVGLVLLGSRLRRGVRPATGEDEVADDA